MWLALVIFAFTYLVILGQKIPYLHLDRPSLRTKHLGLDDPTVAEASTRPAGVPGIERQEFPEARGGEPGCLGIGTPPAAVNGTADGCVLGCPPPWQARDSAIRADFGMIHGDRRGLDRFVPAATVS